MLSRSTSSTCHEKKDCTNMAQNCKIEQASSKGPPPSTGQSIANPPSLPLGSHLLLQHGLSTDHTCIIFECNPADCDPNTSQASNAAVDIACNRCL